MQSDILFDNIYIGHSVADAAAFRAETYDVKRPIEDAEDAATKPPPEAKPSSPMDLSFKDDPLRYMKEKFALFVTIAKDDPLEAIRFLPEVAGALGILAVTLIATVVGAIGMSSATPSQEDVKKTMQKAKDAVVEAKDQTVDAAASGVETVKAEVNKRSTRSTHSSVTD